MNYGGVWTPSGPKPKGERRKELLARMNARRLFTNADTARNERKGNRTNHLPKAKRIVRARSEWDAILYAKWGQV